jgi:hypothetical protein
MQVINLIGLSEDDFLACAEDGLKRKIERHQKLMLTAASLCISSAEEYKKQCQKDELHEAQLTGALHQVQMRRYDLKYGYPDSMIVKEVSHAP